MVGAGRLDRVSQRWGLRVRDRLGGGSRSEVFAANRHDGRQVVVKLATGSDQATREAAALRMWSSTGVTVELLDADHIDHALLLARAHPGHPLPASNIMAAADILRTLHAVWLPDKGFPAFEDVYPELERSSVDDAAYEQAHRNEPNRGRIGLDLLDAARELATALSDTSTRRVLLHGDLLAKNLLRDGTCYRAIDPTPMIGDPCADIGFFAAGTGAVDTILVRARTMAIHCQQDPQRAERWAVVWTVLDTASAWRDDQPALDLFLAGPDAQRLLDG